MSTDEGTSPTSDSGPVLRVAQVVPRTEAEGPGARFSVWIQGCALRCPGCCNPEMFAFERGTAMTVESLAARVLATPGIEGVSILGGEPFSQAGPPRQARLPPRSLARGVAHVGVRKTKR